MRHDWLGGWEERRSTFDIRLATGIGFSNARVHGGQERFGAADALGVGGRTAAGGHGDEGAAGGALWEGAEVLGGGEAGEGDGKGGKCGDSHGDGCMIVLGECDLWERAGC